MTPGEALFLAGAGFLAGSLNAVAGGGSLVSFPALLATNIGSVSANVTNTVALWPGYLGGAIGYRKDLSADRRQLGWFAAIGAIGAVVGSVLLLTTPADIFTALVPWLVLGASVLFALQPLVSRRLRSRKAMVTSDRPSVGAIIGVLLASVYGGYFGAGMGIMLLAILGTTLDASLQRINGLKNALSLTVNTVALVFFAGFGPVRWLPVVIMAVTSLVGGYAGARVARRLPAVALRCAIVVFGMVVGLKLLLG